MPQFLHTCSITWTHFLGGRQPRWLMGAIWCGKDSGIDFNPQAPAGIRASPRDAAGSTRAPEVTRSKYGEMDAPGAAEMKLPAPLGKYYLTHLPPAGIPTVELKALDLSSCLGWDYLETPCLIQTLPKPQAVGFMPFSKALSFYYSLIFRGVLSMCLRIF